MTLFPGLGGLVGLTRGVVSEVLVDRTEGTIIGNYSFVGGSNAPGKAFDGITNQAASSCAASSSLSGFCGKHFSTPRAITRIETHGTNNAGYSGYANTLGGGTSHTFILRANNSSPANRSDGIALGTLVFGEAVNESAAREIISTNQWTKFAYAWVDTIRPDMGGGSTPSEYMGELIFYENENA